MAYQYRPLNQERREIRLLEVLPTGSSANDPLSCRLSHVSLDDTPAPKYETISYFWGNPDPRGLLMLAGKNLRIPLNTALALHRMALPDQSRVLWIDAVCIDQSNHVERAAQVALIGEIYRNATQGLVYFGEESDLARPAFETIEALWPEVQKDIGPAENIEDALWNEHRYLTAADNIQTTFNEDALRTLFSVSWFSRVWIVQEAALARSNICIWGNMTTDLEHIITTAAWLNVYHVDHIPQGLLSMRGLANAADLCLARIDCKRNGGRAVFEILVQSRNLQASDARDKVYGTLGLLRGRDRGSDPGLLTPDYNKSVRHVFQDATKQCILTSRGYGLDILRFISHRDGRDLHVRDFSTWAFRIDREWHHTYDPAEFPRHPYQDIGVKASRKVVDVNLLGVFGSPNVISLRGTHFDDITMTTSVYPPDGYDDDVLQWISEVRALRGASTTRPLQEQTLLRLLIADVNLDAAKRSATYFAGFTVLLQHFAAGRGITPEMLQDANEDLRDAAQIFYELHNRCNIRRAALSKAGYLLLVPKITKPGDFVVDLNGGEYPFVLRACNTDFFMIGECYIDGGMPWQTTEYAAFKQLMHDRPERIFHIV